jgi:hypothetical protein
MAHTDGRITVSAFRLVDQQGGTESRLVRLHPDGSLVARFYSSDGFATVNGRPCYGLARQTRSDSPLSLRPNSSVLNLACLRLPAHSLAVLARDQPSPVQIAIYRRMTPERRLALAEGLYWTAREMKAAWLRAQHADWSESRVSQEVTRIFSHART